MIEIHCFIWLLAMSIVRDVSGHGMLLDPPGRSSMWRVGFDVPINYNDNGLNCGGFQYQQNHGGKCGVCGDPIDGPLNNEAGGKYDTGTIGRRYQAEDRIDITVELTSNHGGWFEFRLCNRQSPRVPVTQQCLDEHLLEVEGSSDKRRRISSGMNRHLIRTQVQLPRNMTCEHCVLQWFYRAAQNRGSGPEGYDCFGCGPQEHFINCADIAISDDVVGANSTRTSHRAPVDDEVEVVDEVSLEEHTSNYRNAPLVNSNGGNNIREHYNENENTNIDAISEEINFSIVSTVNSETNVQNKESFPTFTEVADSERVNGKSEFNVKVSAAETHNIETTTKMTLLVNNQNTKKGDGIIFLLNGNVLKHAILEQNMQGPLFQGDIKYPGKKPHVPSEIKRNTEILSLNSPKNQAKIDYNTRSPLVQAEVINSIHPLDDQSDMLNIKTTPDVQGQINHSIKKSDVQNEIIRNVQELSGRNIEVETHRQKSDVKNKINYNVQSAVNQSERNHNIHSVDVKSNDKINRRQFSKKQIIKGAANHNFKTATIPDVINHDIRRPLAKVGTINNINRPNVHAAYMQKKSNGQDHVAKIENMSKQKSTSEQNLLTNDMSPWKNDPRILYRILRTGTVYGPPTIPKCGHKKVICEGIGLYFDTDFNRYCQTKCLYQQCESTQCVYYCEDETPKCKQQCHGLKKANDKWCLTNCLMGNCPTDICVCVE